MCIPKKKGTRQLSTLSLHLAPTAALHPQQRHIPSNNGHTDQRGFPARRVSLSPIYVNWSEGWRPYWLFSSSWYTDWDTMESHAVSVMCLCVLKHPLLFYMHTHTHTQYTSLYDHDPIAGGVRATIAWAGICSLPAVEKPANGRHCLKKWY